MEGQKLLPATVGKYHPGIYDRLNTFVSARERLWENYRHIAMLGEVFLHHQVHPHYGLRLLHKHFDLFGDEHLVRTHEARHGVTFVSPAPRRMYAVPCLWRAQRGPRGQWLYYPIEFTAYSEFAERRADEFEKLGPFLVDIAEHLESLDLLDVFGIATGSVLAPPCQADQILVETTDNRRRLLSVQAETRADVRVENFTETFWTFYPGDSTPLHASGCKVTASVVAESEVAQSVAATAMSIASAVIVRAAARSF